MGRPRESKHLQMQRAFVERKLGSTVICSRCGATLETYADVCSADLPDLCPGFVTVQEAITEFNSAKPHKPA